jgi:hypothetical protein
MRRGDVYETAGYEIVSINTAIVWDGARFRKHLARAVSDLADWSKTFDPPVTYHNGYTWVYSPGPRPVPASYR